MCGACAKKRVYAGQTSNVPRTPPPGHEAPTPEEQRAATQKSIKNAVDNAQKNQ